MELRLERPWRRRGTVVPLVGLTLGVLLSFTALAVDLGYVYATHGEMQRVVDACALAGASGLPVNNGVATARVLEYAQRNMVAGLPLSPHEAAVTIGNWEGSTNTFFPLTGAETVLPNGIRVVGTRDALSLYFAPVMQVHETNVAKAAVALAGSGHCAGIWAFEGIDGDGDISADSYDSGAGPYGPGNIRPNGDICSCAGIDLAGAVEIFGDAMYGEGYSLISSGNAYNIWGVVGVHECGIAPPDFDINDAAANNDNATIGLTDRGHDPFAGSPWDLVITGNDNLTLAGGTYYFTSVLIDGRASLTVAGRVAIYVSGPAEFAGDGVVNVTQDPNDLFIYSAGLTLVLSGTSGFYGAVIAPQTAVSLVGTGDYYGMMMGRTLEINGTANLHVDESLVWDIFGIESISPVLVE